MTAMRDQKNIQVNATAKSVSPPHDPPKPLGCVAPKLPATTSKQTWQRLRLVLPAQVTDYASGPEGKAANCCNAKNFACACDAYEPTEEERNRRWFVEDQ